MGDKSGYASVTKSSAVKYIPANTLTSAPTPTISGTMKVGETLSVTAGLWKPAPVALDLQWKRNGAAIPFAKKFTYVLTSEDVGASITVSVTGTKPGYTTVMKTSAAKTLPFSTLTATPTPTISGTAKVGETLSATAGLWKPSPVPLDLQWKRDGAAIPFATKSTYALTTDDIGAAITVSVTGNKPGYAPVTKTSAAKTIPFATLTSTPTPYISGTPLVGQTLYVTAGLWQPSPVVLDLQWKRNGVAIPGATKSSYLLEGADQGAAITVSVTGTKPGYAPITKTSAAKTVPLNALTVTPTPIISGTLKVGQTLSVTAGLWQPSPVPLDLQWKRNGVAISGATKSTYKLTSKDAGKTITVSVTGTKAGYASVTKTSTGKSIPK